MTLSLDDVRLVLLWDLYGRSWDALAARLAATTFTVSGWTERARRLAAVGGLALRRRCRRATVAEREDAVRWLVGLAPRPAPAAVDATVRSATTRALVTRLRTSFPAMPRAEMEELIRRGSHVVTELVALLARARLTSAGRALLWPVVVAGEIGDPGTIGVLARLLRHHSIEIATAAAEALGRIGAPARPALEEAATARRDRRAVFGYGGLAMIHTDEVYDFLCERFVSAPEDGDLVAGALARHPRSEVGATSAPRLGRRARRMRGAIAGATGAAGERGADLLVGDWRVRYRRLPSLGWAVPPSWVQVAALVRERRSRAPVRTPPRLGARGSLDGAEHCASCGGDVWLPVGLAACAHTASAIVGLQAGLVRWWHDEGIPDVWGALDRCDDADLFRYGAARRTPKVGEVPLVARVAIARATFYWLANARLEHLAEASRHLDFVAGDLRMLDGGARDDGCRRVARVVRTGREPFRSRVSPCASRPQSFS